MNADPNEIHFDCPNCKRPMSGDKALLGEMLNCPDCNEPFWPVPRKLEPKPEPAKTEVRLECPKCHHKCFVEKKGMLHEFVTCPDCGAAFSPVPSLAQPTNTGGLHSQAQFVAPLDLKSRCEKIRRNAHVLSGIGGFFSVIGLVVGVFSVIALKSGEDATDGFITSAAMIGVGLWFYLVGQVVHIRANTEK